MINNLADAHTPSSLQRAANTYNYVVQTSENSNNQNVFSTDLYQGVTFGDLLNLVRPNRGTFPTSSDKNLGLSQFRPLSTDETQSGSKSLIKSAATHNEHIES